MAMKIISSIARLRPYEAGKPIDALERELGITGAIKLASNENAWGPPPGVFVAIQKALSELHIYPDAANHKLRQAMGAFLGVSPECLVFGNGSNELLSLIVKTFAGPGDTILSSAGSFIAYRIIAMAQGLDFVESPLDAGYGYDLKAMLAAVDDSTRVIFIANPNNPTGTHVGHADIAAFIDAVMAKTAHREPPFIVLDEAYIEYVDATDKVDALALVKAHDHVIAARTFSKAWGLAALRLGYVVCSEEAAGWLNRVREPFNINGLAQVAGLAALEEVAHVDAGVRACIDERHRVFKAFEDLALLPVPSRANFIFLRLNPTQALRLDPEHAGAKAAKMVYDALLRRGIIVRPMGPAGFADAIRITIGLPLENDRMLGALRELLA